MTFSDPYPRYKGHDITECHITRKIELYLQWQTNSTSYVIHRTAPFLTTVNDPYTSFKFTSLFVAEYLRNGKRYGHSCYRGRI